MISNKVIAFLESLKENNNREWFHENKKHYESAKKELEGFINKIIPAIGVFEKEVSNITAKDCVFRIYRDVRFAKDKSPYKTNMGAYISRGGRKGSYAGYYLHIEPSGSFLAGGIYMPQPAVLKAIRQEIFFHADDFKNIIHDVLFKKLFHEIDQADKLKKPPQGFDATFQDIDLLKHKSYVMVHSLKDELLSSTHFFEYAMEVFKAMHPLNSFLNRAVDMME